MADAPGGKYADLCEEVRERSEARGAILLVLGANLGTGFSILSDRDSLLCVPDMLEAIAKKIRESAH